MKCVVKITHPLQNATFPTGDRGEWKTRVFTVCGKQEEVEERSKAAGERR